MAFYNLHCERCGGVQPHEIPFEHEDEKVQMREHPDIGESVYCRNCERGNSKADLDGDTDIWVNANISQGVSMTVHPDFIPDDETLEQYIERRLREEYIGRLAAEVADGLRENDVAFAGYEVEDD